MSPDRSLFLSPVDPPDPPPSGRGEEQAGGDGGEGAPSPGGSVEVAVHGRRRRLAAVAVVVLLGVAAVAANRVTAPGQAEERRSDDAAADERRPPTTRPRASTTTLPATLQTSAVRGPLLPEPTGTTVVLASARQLVLAHLDTGTVRSVGMERLEVHGGYPYSAILPLGDGLLTSGERPTLVPRHPGAPLTEVRVPGYGGYLPSAVEGRFWYLDHRFEMELVERDLTGETGRRVTVPGESGAVLPLGDGFVISPLGSVLRVDATTGAAERLADGTAVAVDERTLARVRCDESLECPLVLSDIDGGRERVVPTPTPRSRYETYGGVRFSPDGRWLVTPFYGEDQPGGLTVVDVERGERRFLDSLATSSGGGFPLSAAFTADSRWLLLADPEPAASPVRAIRIEDGAVVELDLGVDPSRGGEGTVLLALPSIPADADPTG